MAQCPPLRTLVFPVVLGFAAAIHIRLYYHFSTLFLSVGQWALFSYVFPPWFKPLDQDPN